MQNNDVTFIRKNGRIIPIKKKNQSKPKPVKKPKKDIDAFDQINTIVRGAFRGKSKGEKIGTAVGVGVGIPTGIGVALGSTMGIAKLRSTKLGAKIARKIGRKGRKAAYIAGATGIIAAGYGAFSSIQKRATKQGAKMGWKKGAREAAESVGATIAPGGIFDPQ